MTVYYYIMFFIIGACFGSFYNVVGMRLPIGSSINVPRSHCDNCGHILKWYELLPIVSYFIQNGKCKNCKMKLSLFYPIIEFATGLLFMISFHSFSFSYDLIISLTLVSLFMVVIVSDLTYLLIPDSVIIISSFIIFIAKILDFGMLNGLIQIGYGLISFCGMYLVMLLGNKLFKKESLGGADIKLMFLVGLTLNPMLSIVVVFLSSFIALPVSVFLLLKNNEHVIPFGPFIMFSLVLIFFTKLNIIDIFNKILNVF